MSQEIAVLLHPEGNVLWRNRVKMISNVHCSPLDMYYD